MSALLEAEGLACRRGGRVVVAGVGFALRAGDALLLRGPNGSGKSSLLRLLAGFLPPAAGRLCWQGADIVDDQVGYRARLHHLGHQDAVKGVLSVAENLGFWQGIAGGRGDPAAALAAFGLEALADWPGRLLSAGQRRRLALARLLAAPRPLWLLDEPETGLDAASRAALAAAIARHREGGGVAVVASHGEPPLPATHLLTLGG